MADIESVVVRLASSDLDSADAASTRAEEVKKATELVKDSAVRRNLGETTGFVAAKECTSYASFERVLSVLTEALSCETKDGDDRSNEVIDSLAEVICFLIVSSAESSKLLTASAKTKLRIRSDTVSGAFAKVSQENKEVGDILAKVTAKGKKKSASESLSTTEQDILAKNRGRRSGGLSRPGAHAVSGNEAAALDKRIATKTNSNRSNASGYSAGMSQEERDAAAKNRARRTVKVNDAAMTSGVRQDEDAAAKQRARRSMAVVPGVVREPSVGGDMAEPQPDGESRKSGSSAGVELRRIESDVVAKNRARRKPHGMAVTPGVTREVSSGSELTEDTGDFQAKSRARRTLSSASANLDRLENDVISKNRARRSSRNAEQSAAAGNRLNHLEADIRAKSCSRKSRTARGADRTDINALEGDVLAKSRNRKPDSKNSKKDQQLPLSQVPGAVYERDDGRSPVESDDDFYDEYDYEKADKDIGHKIRVDDTTGALLATDRGIANRPVVEFGQYRPGDTMYADIGNFDPDTGLAVAVAVSPEEEDVLIPSAVELDPDAKPSITRNRRFRLYACLAVVLLILIVTVVSVTLTAKKDNSVDAPTPSPTSVAEGSIRNQLQIVVGEDKMKDKSSPESKAADWIIYEDPMQLSSDSPNLVQRYVLAVFYISTTQDTPWLSCNRPEEGETSDCLYKLLTAAFPFIVYEQVEWYRWLSEEHECDWAGVYCDDTEVVRALELWGQEISGTLPAALKELTYLQSIALQWNNFHGTLPKEWAEMQHLLNIEVHYNWLDGQVPEEWWTSSRWAMQRLNIAANQFSGTIPTEIGALNGLKGFFTFENEMTGTFPTELGNVEFLAFTRQGRNFIEGTLPTELGRLEMMQEMWLHRNKINGTIPSELGLMTDLGDLRLHFNPLTGTIPTELYELHELTRIDLYDCDLSGTISTLIGDMWSMEAFRIRANNFYGTIPTEIGLLDYIEEVWIHRNNFVGQVPDELCALRPSSGARVGLQYVDADCGETITADGFGPPQIECAKGCCTRCCDSSTGLCDN